MCNTMHIFVQVCRACTAPMSKNAVLQQQLSATLALHAKAFGRSQAGPSARLIRSQVRKMPKTCVDTVSTLAHTCVPRIQELICMVYLLFVVCHFVYLRTGE